MSFDYCKILKFSPEIFKSFGFDKLLATKFKKSYSETDALQNIL